ncbi:proline-tRNA ligase [Paracoccidioides brasiliensis Pb03]|nr:proline-tRNA ligase [Paracoccidioides brasiliensis Pb03]
MSSQQLQDDSSASAHPVQAVTQLLPDRTMDPATGENHPAGEVSKNAAKKAAKKEKLAAEKSEKSANKSIGKSEAKNVTTQKASKKKPDGPALIGIDVLKNDDFPGWYQQVLLKGEMLDYYDVSGCFILKPHSYFIWETIQTWFNDKIKKMGVKNCSFPLFVSEDVLNKEKDHIEGFAAEVAWVTHAGNSKLERKIAIRPTSETVMYPYYAKWIRSHRDLPLRLNQWNSVVRWEFKNPQPFLRTREFLWQEGHTAHLTEAAAREEVLQILEHYAHVYEELLAVPVIRGQKTEKEKFAGGLYTTTVEGYIPATGRGIQGGTSHGLGQNFSKMFGITVEDPSAKPDEKKPALHVWQNSWGLSTRTIGIMVMVHGDDRGLVLPPRVADVQTVIIPVGITAKTTDKERASLYAEIDALAAVIEDAGVRVEVDKRDNSPGWKFNDWELRGIPLRLEFGPGESTGHFVTTSRRDIPGKDGKSTIPISELKTQVPALLETIQADLYKRAEKTFRAHVKHITNWDDFSPALNEKNLCLIPHCLTEQCEDEIKDMSARKVEEETGESQDAKAPSMGAKSLCIPFEQPPGIEKGVTKCTNPNCQRFAENWCLFGRKLQLSFISPSQRIFHHCALCLVADYRN